MGASDRPRSAEMGGGWQPAAAPIACTDRRTSTGSQGQGGQASAASTNANQATVA